MIYKKNINVGLGLQPTITVIYNYIYVSPVNNLFNLYNHVGHYVVVTKGNIIYI